MLEIFGAGFGRTGTFSLKLALEQLGYEPCHHMLTLPEDPEQCPLWRRAARGEPMDWTKVYARYRSSVDWPGARFWREITAAFPAAKVILTVREPESWYESAASTIHRAATATPPPDAPPGYVEMRDMAMDVVWDGQFGGRFDDKEHALRVYEEHNAAVQREIDPERLLVYEVGQGWEPLCGFLGVPVPDGPFPRSNDAAQFAAQVEELTARMHAAPHGPAGEHGTTPT